MGEPVRKNSYFVEFIGGVLATVCLFLWQTDVRAQTVSGTILGVIQDQQGAAIANADVSARNLETGAVRKASADGNGNYRISSVPAGSYEISASSSGFKTEVRSGVVVTVGGDVGVNFSLTVGTINEKVEVTGEAPQVDTASSTLGGFVNSATIRELPLNGRDWLQLALLQPGAVAAAGEAQAGSARPQRGNGIAIAISGGRPTDNAFRIDGMIVNDYANGGPGSSLRVNLGVDAIQEFSVLTTNYSAEYGRGSGGIVNAITKSGTNQIHGSAYGFVRNSAFDARNFFDGKTIPAFHRAQYGGAIGLPIQKDKTFFFTNYEKLGELKSLSSSVTTLSANAHNGIVCANSACTQTTQVKIAPSIKPYLALYPLPNGAVTGNTGVFAYPQPRIGEENYVIGKIDHYFSPSTILTVSYTYDNTTLSNADDFDLMTANAPSLRQNGVISLQHVFSPNLINNVRAGVSRTYAAGNLDVSASNPALSDPALGYLPGRDLGPLSISGVTGVYGGLGSGFESNGPNIFGYTAPQAYDDVSWTKGRNSIRTGFSFERVDYNINAGNKPNGVWTFGSVQGFLQGTPTQFQADFPGTNAVRGLRMSVIGGYIQDDFRMRPNLTINLGLRYEMGTVPTEVNGEMSNLRNLTDSLPTTGNPYFHNPTLKNFAPRVGFAWDPFKDGKTAVRGGAGIFDIIALPYLFQNRITRTSPYFLQGTLSNPPASSFPNEAFQLFTNSSLSATEVEYNPAPSYKVQWNLNIQRQLTKSMALTVGYVGSAGVHLAHIIDDTDQVPPNLVTFNTAIDAYTFPIPAKGTAIQRINPNFGKISLTEWDGHSSYDAMQVNLVQRPIRGLFYQIAYTWSKSIDNGSSTLSDQEYANNTGPSWAFDPTINRAVSDFNVPQSLVVNFQYELPVPKAVKTHSVVNAFMGGWQVGGIYTVQTGGPFSVKIGGDQADTGNSTVAGLSGGQRPMYVNAPGCNPDAVTGNIGNYVMTQCFAFPAPGVLGNLGRNTLRMPMFRDFDFSVFKNQNVWGEKLRVQFRAEAFNIFNNVNLQPQLRTIFDASGNLVSTIGTALGPTVNTSRQIQFGLKLIF